MTAPTPIVGVRSSHLRFMDIMPHWTILGLLFCSAFSTIDAQLSNDRQIYDKIFTGYSKEVRPVMDSSKSVRVEIKFELTKINQIDDVNQQMHVVGFYIAQWTDENLVWNASDYGNIDRIVVRATKVWLPDFAIVNSADVFYKSEFVNDFRVLITSNGLVTWSFGGNIIVSCELDLTYYPFDSQLCYMAVENWQYDKSEVELVNSTSEIETAEYHTNGMWTVTSTISKASLIYHAAFPGVAYPLVKFEITMTRKPGYYVVNILMPCLLLAFLALLVFWLPPDAGEKIGLGITIILAFGVFALLIAQSTPQTSDSYPLLSIWMCILIIVSSLNTVMSIIVLYCHHHLPTRPPALLRSIFIKMLGRVLCVGGMLEEPGQDDIQEIRASDVIITDAESIRKQPIGDGNTVGVKSVQVELLERVTEVLKELTVISKSIMDAEEGSAAQDEWMAIARVIDRLCFWVNLCVILVATIICFTLRGGVLSDD